MNYIEKLQKSSSLSGNCICMGLDLQHQYLPKKGNSFSEDATEFCKELFSAMLDENLIPAAFKPNIGYYVVYDKPRKGQFDGSVALNSVISLIEEYFPSIPIILDSKRGDIQRSSLNYAIEAFECWDADAVTISPYMGDDSVSPFGFKNKGTYILNRTSNPGSADFQNLLVDDNSLYMIVAQKIASWAKTYRGFGAVVGATNLKELYDIAHFYSDKEIPLLIPGVGSQGASAKETLDVLKEANYPLALARINSSSNLTHPHKSETIPANYLEQSLENIASLIKECSI